MAPLLLDFAADGGVEESIRRNPFARSGVYMFNGQVTHHGLAAESALPFKTLTCCWHHSEPSEALVIPETTR